MVSVDLTSKGHQHERGAAPLIIFEFICVVGVARCVVGMEEHPQSIPLSQRQDAVPQPRFVMSMHLLHLPLALVRIAVEKDPLQSCDPTNSLVSE